MSSKILVVDDETEICLLLTEMLRKLGFDTEYAQNVKDARHRLDTNNYDLVFLDLNLPDGLGFHLISDVHTTSPASKVIVISAYDGNIERQRANAEGADYFIPKPFNKKMILGALNELKISYTA